MKSLAAKALLNQIDQAVIDIQSFPNSSALEQSYFAKFLVVFICGIYEEAIETIINEWIARFNSVQISKFISSSLQYTFSNPNTDNIERMLKRFDDSWRKQIVQLPSQAKTSLNSMVNDKNSLAHGGSCNITLNDVVRFYQDSKVVIETIDQVVL
jgi:hypothetical protein